MTSSPRHRPRRAAPAPDRAVGTVGWCRPGHARAGHRPHPDQHRDGHRGQARGRQARAGGAARRGPPAHRGRPRRRQDDAQQGARPLHRLHGPAHPVHARPAALRRHRRLGLQPGHPAVRVPAGRHLREHRGRRRDQPRLPQDPVGAARVHGGAPGHRRRDDVPPRRAVHGDRDPEPDRDGGHLRPARGAARPVHGAGLDGLPGRGRRDRDARQPTRTPTRSTTSSRSPTPPRSAS